MRHLFAMDARRAFGQGRLWFLAAGIVLLLFVNSRGFGHNFFPSAVYVLQHAAINFIQQGILILAAFGYAGAFCEDWKNRNIRNILARSSPKRYAVSKICVCALAGFVTYFVAYIVFALLAGLLAGGVWIGNPNYVMGDRGESIPIWDGCASDALLLAGNFPLWLVCRGVRHALEGSFFAVISLAISTLIPNELIVLTIPAITHFLLNFFPVKLSFLPIFRIDAIYENSAFYLFDSVWLHLLLELALTAAVCLLMGVLFYFGVQRRLERG